MSGIDVIQIEKTIRYEFTREDVSGWTQAEWTEAFEAALRGDTRHEAWDMLPRGCEVDVEITEAEVGMRPTVGSKA